MKEELYREEYMWLNTRLELYQNKEAVGNAINYDAVFSQRNVQEYSLTSDKLSITSMRAVETFANKTNK